MNSASPDHPISDDDLKVAIKRLQRLYRLAWRTLHAGGRVVGTLGEQLQPWINQFGRAKTIQLLKDSIASFNDDPQAVAAFCARFDFFGSKELAQEAEDDLHQQYRYLGRRLGIPIRQIPRMAIAVDDRSRIRREKPEATTGPPR
jgi:hypothetical protein